MLDLQKFCASESDDPRSYIHKPWSAGDYSYATNGHILVRVPRRDDVPENPENPITAEKLSRVIGERPSDVWRTPEIVGLPPLVETECEDCDGMGAACHCSTCECECSKCGGTGNRSSDVGKSARYRRVPFALKYIRAVCSFPSVEICDQSGPEMPLRFRFDGGIGSVMPLRTDTHCDAVQVFAEHDAQAAPDPAQEQSND